MDVVFRNHVDQDGKSVEVCDVVMSSGTTGTFLADELAPSASEEQGKGLNYKEAYPRAFAKFKADAPKDGGELPGTATGPVTPGQVRESRATGTKGAANTKPKDDPEKVLPKEGFQVAEGAQASAASKKAEKPAEGIDVPKDAQTFAGNEKSMQKPRP